MTGRTRFASVAAAALILLSGCTGSSDDPKADDPAPTVAADPSTDPCTMISAASLKKVNPGDKEPRTALMTGRAEFVGCQIGDAYNFAFGYRAVASGPSLQVQVGPASTKEDGIGDEAYVDQSDYAMVVGARFGDNEIIVRNDSLGNVGADNRIDEDTTLAVVKELGKNLPKDLKTLIEPLELGKGCPAADSKQVVAVTGSVVLARGGPHDEDTTCDYLGTGGTSIHLSRSSASNAADFLGNNDRAEPADLDGVVKAEISVDPSGGDGEVVIQPTKDEIAFVRASRGVDSPDATSGRKIAKKAALALAAAFLDGTS